MKSLLLCAAALAVSFGSAMAQDRDFLSAAEAEQIKDAQEPGARIALYVQIAKRRLDLVKSLLAKDRPGRSLMIHDALDDYAKIIDAMDDVADDALQRKHDVAKGVELQRSAESDMLAMLERIRDGHPKDIDHYDFVLKMAIETTSDSIDVNRTDLAERADDVEARANREKKALQAAGAGVAPDAKNAKVEQKPPENVVPNSTAPDQQKPPTLLRPGEKLSTLGGPGGKQ
jgi:hypothetical protein